MTEVIKCMGVAAPRCEKAVTNDTLLCVEGKSGEVGGLCDSESEVCGVRTRVGFL